MAKGNFVRVNDVINPFDGLTRSVENLGSIYGQQAAIQAQEERAELARQDMLAGRAEDKRRFELKESQAQRQRDIASDFMSGYNRQTAVDNWMANNKDAAGEINKFREDNRKAIARNVLMEQTLDKDGKITNRLDGVFSGDLPIHKDFDNAASKLESLHSRGLLGDGVYKNYQKRLDDLKSRTDSYIAEKLPIYQGQEQANIFRSLTAKGLDPATADRISKNLVTGFDNKDKLTAQAIAVQRSETARQNSLATAAYRAHSLGLRDDKKKWRKNYSKSIKPDWQSENDVRNFIKQEFNDKGETFNDLHDWEHDKLLHYWDQAVKSGVDRNIAMLALGDFVEEAPIWGKDVKGTAEDFVTFAKGLSNLESGNSGSVSDLMTALTPAASPYRDPIEQNRKAFYGGLRLLRPNPYSRLPMVQPDLVPNTVNKEILDRVLDKNTEEPAAPELLPGEIPSIEETNPQALPEPDVTPVNADVDPLVAADAILAAEAARENAPGQLTQTVNKLRQGIGQDINTVIDGIRNLPQNLRGLASLFVDDVSRRAQGKFVNISPEDREAIREYEAKRKEELLARSRRNEVNNEKFREYARNVVLGNVPQRDINYVSGPFDSLSGGSAQQQRLEKDLRALELMRENGSLADITQLVNRIRRLQALTR